MISAFFSFLIAFSSKFGYGGIVFLMAVESSFIPFPSEIVIPPAAYLASQGRFNIYLVVLSGVLGSLIGAAINYYLAKTLGRALVYSLAEKKIFKLLLIDAKKIEKAEKYFLDFGNASTLLGRMVPAVRQLISLPAGFSRMPLKYFFFFTFLGSGIWVTILALLGFYLGENKTLLALYYEELKIAAIIIFLIFLAYIAYRIKALKKHNA